ncbi:MAG: hypothetical protein UV58_C0014G0020 [Candidatus Wolfebacteria bacterium GW2011_GWC1_43_10]|uniref:Uncharacterized protein n=1 Tax=Candidatus Wolfebacteria bacterium GW2011_GWC1_43_10 TaxID=1619011 RepID=A0A0G1C958_9BACT|nr:MAG: hypothetical protein UV58_C0014G0020 [Candidatus Wolfebacteria bacterium GW2011_GWC1_43_10]KKT22816.1 MAG: hypothetical protein UW08_C0003G0052 [Parcubacteria group bacterium GW2011_GWB1_43_8b]
MKTNKIILGFVSEIGGGKGTLTKYIEQKYDAKTFRFSTILRDILERVYLPDTRENMQILSTKLRETFGQDILSKTISQDIQASDSKIIVLDGIRRIEDTAYLKNIPGFYVIAIEADERIRFERLNSRGENPDDTKKTWEEFQKDIQYETEMTIREVAKIADFKIDNNGSLEETYRQVDKIVASIQ